MFHAPLVNAAEKFDPLPELDHYNVVWNSPGPDEAASMPIGNGEVGLNAWVEPGGDLLFYISRVDALSECSRVLKLGRVRVKFSPNPFTKDTPFRQELKLRDGQIVITSGDETLRLFVDADAPVIHLTGNGKTPRTVEATIENWRTEARVLPKEEIEASCWTMRVPPADIKVAESGDVFIEQTNTVTWYHRNEHSIVPFTLKHQGVESLSNLVTDPLLHRTFGGCMMGAGFVSQDLHSLKSTGPAKEFSLAITTRSWPP